MSGRKRGSPDQRRKKKIDALARAESRHRAPCEVCYRRSLCNEFRLACGTFEHWVRTGRLPGVRLRHPNPDVYDRIYSGQEDDE